MGYRLELYCTQLYRHQGKLAVTHNIQYNFRRVLGKKLVTKVQVDIEYLDLLRKMTVECKYHKNGNVNANEIEEFLDKLHKLDRSYATMITNAEYSSTAAKIARKNKIRLFDHDTLNKMSKKMFSHKTLEQRIRETKLNGKYKNPTIRTVYVLI